MNAERKFGIIISSAYLIFLLVFFDYDLKNISLVWYSPLAILAILMIFSPKLISPIRKGWLYIGHILGIINSTLILSIIYFVIITPVSVLRKLFTSRKGNVDSNWHSPSDAEKGSFYKQY